MYTTGQTHGKPLDGERQDAVFQFDDQFDVSSSNPDLHGLGSRAGAGGGPDAETTAGINTSMPSKDQQTTRSSALDGGDGKRDSAHAAVGRAGVAQDARAEGDTARKQRSSVGSRTPGEGARVANRYAEPAPPQVLQSVQPPNPEQEMQLQAQASALSDYLPDAEAVHQQYAAGIVGRAAALNLTDNYKSNPALNQNYFTPMQTMASSAGGPSGVVKWSESLAQISQRTERNLDGLGLMNTDPAARERAMTEQERRRRSGERGHEEREMDLLERQKSAESLNKLIRENQPGAQEQDLKASQQLHFKLPRGSKRTSPGRRAGQQSSHMAPMTPAPRSPSILSSLDFYGRYNPISQQGIDLNQQQPRRASPDAFQMFGTGDQNDILNDQAFAFGHQLPLGGHSRTDQHRSYLANKLRSRSAGTRFDGGPAPAYNNFTSGPPPAANPQAFRDFRSAASLEVRALVDQAKQNIKHFYDMYDQKLRAQLTHPLFRGIDENPETNKVQVLTEQVDLLESEMAKRIRDVVWAQSLLKKDQIATKKRMGVMVTDKQLDVQLSAFRGHVQDQLSQFTRDMLEMRAMINSQKFEIETRLLNHVKSMGQGRSLQHGHGGQDASMAPGGANQEEPHAATVLTRQAFVQQKSEIYDYLSHQLAELGTTYSAKLDLLSNFMLQAQDQIRDLQGTKGSGDLNVKDISSQLQHRDKIVRDSLHQNSQQLIQLSNTLKDQSGFIMRLKGQLAEIKSQQEDSESRRSEAIASLHGRLENVESDLEKKVQAAAAQAQVQSNQQQSQQPIAEVVKQISKLASSLQSFEQDNISKIQRTHKEMQGLQLEMSQIKNDIRLGSERQEEAEQSFLKSFQDIKTIVLTKLQVFDKQIESKEEWERMREVLQSEQIVQKTLRDQMTAIAQKVHEQGESISLMDKKLAETTDGGANKNGDLTADVRKALQDKFEALHANHEHRLALVENQLRGIYSQSILTSATVGEGDMNRSPGINPRSAATRAGAHPVLQQQQWNEASKTAAPQLIHVQHEAARQSNQVMAKQPRKDEHSSSHEKEADDLAKKSAEASDAEQQLRDQIASHHAASPEHAAHKSRNSILDSSTHLRSSNRNQNSAIQVEDQNQEAANSAEVLKSKAEADGRGTNVGSEGVDGGARAGFALKDPVRVPPPQQQTSEERSSLTAKQDENEVTGVAVEDFGRNEIPANAGDSKSRSSRPEVLPLKSPESKEPTHSAEKHQLKSNDRSSQSRFGGLPSNSRDQRESMRNGSDDEDEEITNPFITDQDGNKAGIATVTSNVNIGTTGQGFQSTDFKLGAQKDTADQGASPHQFYASAEQIQPSSSPIEPYRSPEQLPVRPKTKTGRMEPVDAPSRGSSLASNDAKGEGSAPIFIEGRPEMAFAVTGETQNILVMDDKRDESKPSVPSGHSGASLISAPSGQLSQRDYQMQSSRSQNTRDQKPIVISTFVPHRAIPSSPFLADQDNEQSERRQDVAQFNEANHNQMMKIDGKASMGNTSQEMVHLNSSGETVPPSPLVGTPSQKQDAQPKDRSALSQAPEDPAHIEKGSDEVLEELSTQNKKAAPEETSSEPPKQPKIEEKPSSSVDKATRELKDKVALQQLKKQQAKAADQITFEILADTVAKEIAVMLRATVDRNRSKSKKI